MKTKPSRIALLAFISVALVVVGVAVWPTPKPALATHSKLDVLFVIDWEFGGPAYDAEAIVELYDVNWNLLAGWSSPFTPNENYTNWTTEFTNITNDAVNYRIVWNYEGHGWVAAEPPIEGDIDWNNASIERMTRCWDEP
jgi:hypothetical protein